jgi:hypothetical protein
LPIHALAFSPRIPERRNAWASALHSFRGLRERIAVALQRGGAAVIRKFAQRCRRRRNSSRSHPRAPRAPANLRPFRLHPPPLLCAGQAPIQYYDREHTTIFINNNGGVSFQAGVRAYVPQPFPLRETSGVRMIAPFWADVDTRGSVASTLEDKATPNRVYYRVVDARERADPDAARLAAEVAAAFPAEPAFVPSAVVVATWYRVGAFNQGTFPLNTFQLVLGSDGRRTFVVFNYAELHWLTGSASGGVNPNCGFDAGDGATSTTLPGSFTEGVRQLVNRSNVGVPGVWAFRVDSSITSAGCAAGSVGSVVPPRGSVLGGDVVTVYGPCLNATAVAERPGLLLCRFGNGTALAGSGNATTNSSGSGGSIPLLPVGDGGVTTTSGADVAAVVPARLLTNASAACVAPFSRRTGTVPVFLSQDAGASWAAVAAYTYVPPETPGLPALLLRPGAASGAPDGGPLLWPATPAATAAAGGGGVDVALAWPLTPAEAAGIDAEWLVYELSLWEVSDAAVGGAARLWAAAGGPPLAADVTPELRARYAAAASAGYAATVTRRAYTTAEGDDATRIGGMTTGINEFGVLPPGAIGAAAAAAAPLGLGVWAGRLPLDAGVTAALAVRPVFLRLTARDARSPRWPVVQRTSNLRWLLPGAPPPPSGAANATAAWDAHAACAAWSALQPAATTWNAGLPRCPQTAGQVSAGTWAPAEDCTGASNASSSAAFTLPGTGGTAAAAVGAWGTADCWHRRGRPQFAELSAARCVRSWVRNGAGAAAECCYDAAGRLVVTGGGGGTDARFATQPAPVAHWFADVLPRVACCALSPVFADCDGAARPAGGGAFSWRGSGVGLGDPHFLRLDGTGVTFNGAGDYVYLGTLEAGGGGNLSAVPAAAALAAAAASPTAPLPPGVAFLSWVRLLPLAAPASTRVTAVRGWAARHTDGTTVAVTLRGGQLYVRVNGVPVELQQVPAASGGGGNATAAATADLAARLPGRVRPPEAAVAVGAALAAGGGSAAALLAAPGREALVHLPAVGSSGGDGAAAQQPAGVDLTFLAGDRALTVTWPAAGLAVRIVHERAPLPRGNATGAAAAAAVAAALDGAFMTVQVDAAQRHTGATFGLMGAFTGAPPGTPPPPPTPVPLRRLRALQAAGAPSTSQRAAFAQIKAAWEAPGGAALFGDPPPAGASAFVPLFTDEALPPTTDAQLAAAAAAACGAAPADAAAAAAAGNVSTLPFAQGACLSDALATGLPELGAGTLAALAAGATAQLLASAPAPEFDAAVNPTALTVVTGAAMPATTTVSAAYPAAAVAAAAAAAVPRTIVYSVVAAPSGVGCSVGAASGVLACAPSPPEAGSPVTALTPLGFVTVAATDPATGAGATLSLPLLVAPASGTATPSATPSWTSSLTATRSASRSAASTGTATGSASPTQSPSTSPSPSHSPAPVALGASGRDTTTVAGAAAAAVLGCAALLLLAGCFLARRRRQKAGQKARGGPADPAGGGGGFAGFNPSFKHAALASRGSTAARAGVPSSGRQMPALPPHQLARGSSLRDTQQLQYGDPRLRTTRAAYGPTGLVAGSSGRSLISSSASAAQPAGGSGHNRSARSLAAVAALSPAAKHFAVSGGGGGGASGRSLLPPHQRQQVQAAPATAHSSRREALATAGTPPARGASARRLVM